MSTPFMLFRNGLLLTQGLDYTVSGAWIELVSAQAILPTDSFTAVISAGGTACSTYDGSVSGTVDGTNYLFVLPFSAATVMLFRNGLLLTEGLDYNHTADEVALSAAQVPISTDVLTAQIWSSGGPLQITTWDDTLDYSVAAAVLPFRNGLAQSPPFDAAVSGNTVTFALPGLPQPGDLITAQAWTPNAADPDMPPLNLPVRFGSDDGSITGALNGVNNTFILKTTGLVTAMMLNWNGLAMTEGPDYSWTCTQQDSAGAWSTTITMLGRQIPNAADLLAAMVFTQ